MIKSPADSVSGEDPLPGHRWGRVSSCCVLTWCKAGGGSLGSPLHGC